MLFADTSLVARIEQAEARALGAIIAACPGDAFAEPAGSGLALWSHRGSPLNKVAGAGFEPLEASAVARLEERYHALDDAIQFEISTHADPALSNLLARRGYRITGFEYVLGRALGEEAALGPHTPPEIEVRRARSDELELWIDVLLAGALVRAGDERAPQHDSFEREVLERTYRDMVRAPDLEPWIAFRGTAVAGGALMSVRDGVTQLFGAATHPAQRRHGVQSALLAARFAAGAERGSDVAVVTTQPGSQSQRNVQRAGFALLYARAIWQLDA